MSFNISLSQPDPLSKKKLGEEGDTRLNIESLCAVLIVVEWLEYHWKE